VNNEKRRPERRRSENTAAAKLPGSVADSNGASDIPALFDTVVDSHAYGRTTTLVPSEYVRGPGPLLATTGPEDAQAPAWWWAEAERIVLALTDSGHGVSSDDLHERFPDEPSASGAAFGALFAKLAREGKLREIGMVKSRRPEARRRRIILWGAP
jgi:hypothetical protein